MALRIRKREVEVVKTHLSSPWASFAAIVLATIWTIPTLGLFVTSFRPSTGINSSGWWTVLTNPEFTLTITQECFLREPAPLHLLAFTSSILSRS